MRLTQRQYIQLYNDAMFMFVQGIPIYSRFKKRLYFSEREFRALVVQWWKCEQISSRAYVKYPSGVSNGVLSVLCFDNYK